MVVEDAILLELEGGEDRAVAAIVVVVVLTYNMKPRFVRSA